MIKNRHFHLINWKLSSHWSMPETYTEKLILQDFLWNKLYGPDNILNPPCQEVTIVK